ncbi:MAG: hypothetical protein ACRD2W_09500 [Acidimicrobiales bacterium]
MSRMVRVMGAFVLVALVLAGCGETSGNVGGDQQAVIDQADEICLDAQDAVGTTLGDDPGADRDAIRAATEKLMAINEPSQNQNRWELFVQNHNNLWIVLDDIAQSLDPNVNDRARADRARVTMASVHDNLKKYAGQYKAEECANGYGRAPRNRD